MKTIYLKNTIENIISISYWFYKIVEINDEKTLTLTVTKNSIEIDNDEEFHEQVAFVKNKLCSNGKVEEVKRTEFDEFYKKTVNEINKLTSI